MENDWAIAHTILLELSPLIAMFKSAECSGFASHWIEELRRMTASPHVQD
jgi:hypothetical protein